MDDKSYVTGDIEGLDPMEFPPPRNKKIICITKYGVAVIAHWVDDFHIAWSPLPRIPQSVRKRCDAGAVRGV